MLKSSLLLTVSLFKAGCDMQLEYKSFHNHFERRYNQHILINISFITVIKDTIKFRGGFLLHIDDRIWKHQTRQNGCDMKTIHTHHIQIGELILRGVGSQSKKCWQFSCCDKNERVEPFLMTIHDWIKLIKRLWYDNRKQQVTVPFWVLSNVIPPCGCGGRCILFYSMNLKLSTIVKTSNFHQSWLW